MTQENADTPPAEVTILSIDAWGNRKDGYDWNMWHQIGKITTSTLDTLTKDRKLESRRVLGWLRREGYLSAHSAGHVALDDDQYNLVVIDRVTLQPLIAIAYGEAT